MRKGNATLLASLATLAMLTAPVLAKSSGAQKAEEKPASSSPCHSYVQNPDGSWTAVPCQEIGPATQAQHRSPARNGDDAERE